MSSTDALRRLIAEANAIHDVVAASLGVNATDLRCLELIEAEPDLTPTRLAELAGITSGAVTGVLDRLEASGFVRRETDPNDRRRFIVRAAPERMAEVAEAYRPVLDHVEKLIAPAGASYLEDLAASLARETERLRVATEGGIIDNTFTAPLGDVTRARLVLATGAPRLNWGGAALGQQVRMVAETAATRLRLRAAATGGQLVRAEFVGPPPDVRIASGSVTMRYRRRMLDARSREVDAALHPSASWGIEIDGGITDLEADLRKVALTGIDMAGGANHVKLALPRPSGTVRIALAGGTSQMRVTRPGDVPVSLLARGGVANLRFDGTRKRASGTDVHLSSGAWASTPDRYEVEIAGGAAHLDIEQSR